MLQMRGQGPLIQLLEEGRSIEIDLRNFHEDQISYSSLWNQLRQKDIASLARKLVYLYVTVCNFGVLSE